MKNLKFYFVLLCLILFAAAAQSVPAYPYPKTIMQPDGTELSVILKGDEFYHYYTTEDGFLILKDTKGVFNYAEIDSSGNEIDTHVKAENASKRSPSERIFLKNISQNIDFSKKRLEIKASKVPGISKSNQNSVPAKFPKTGSPKSLVILVNFADISFVTPTPQAAFSALLNENGYSQNGGTGSARDYFRDNSMGAFTPQFDVVGPYTLPEPMSFYGANDSDGNDIDPMQMVVDACTLAKNAGVNFTEYDTDNDNIVDNVFIYYAGHNEAEHAPKETIWPHRWGIYPKAMFGNSGNYSGTVASVTFDGKRIEEYACTSELKGSTGTTMAGIGTFVHEFGHVLGLADMYPTNGAMHFTLSYWNVMTDGAYLNGGRTPPAYNAFERIQLGFLTPTLLKNYPQSNTLDALTTSNQAFLISPSDYYSWIGESPSPTEFFLLENRQQTGWDQFLPGHGMLVYRINFDTNDWDYNIPNNDPDKMGVDIMEADGVGSDETMSGDPFPGTESITFYSLNRRGGTSLNKVLTNITETNGVISFNVDKLLVAPTVPADAKTIPVNNTQFIAKWSAVNDATGYVLDVYSKSESGTAQIVFSENFDLFTNGSPNSSTNSLDVSGELNNFTLTKGWSGAKIFEAGGSVKIGSSDQLGSIATPALNLSANNGKFTLNFDAMAWNGDDKMMKIYVNDVLVHTLTDLNNNTTYAFKSYALPFTIGKSSTTIKFEGNKASKSRFFLDNLTITQENEPVKIPVAHSPFSTSEISQDIINLQTEVPYFYSVRATNASQTSAFSNEVGPIFLTQTGVIAPASYNLQIQVSNGKLIFEASKGETIEVFNSMGQRILQTHTVEGVNEISILTKGILIVKVGERVGKVVD